VTADGTVHCDSGKVVPGREFGGGGAGPMRKQYYLFKSITTDQYGHFDLRGLAPGKIQIVQLGRYGTGRVGRYGLPKSF